MNIALNEFNPNNIIFSTKIENLYHDKKQNIKKDLVSNYVRSYTQKKYSYIETENHIYKFMNKSLLNIMHKKNIPDEEILKALLLGNWLISPSFLKKFKDISEIKIRNVLLDFFKDCIICEKKQDSIYLKNNLHDATIIYDYHNNYLDNIFVNEKNKNHDIEYFGFNKDKITLLNVIPASKTQNKDVLKQLNYLDSYKYDISLYKDDFTNKKINKIVPTDNGFILYTKNNEYIIENYNITKILNAPLNKNLKINEPNFDKINLESLFVQCTIQPEFIISEKLTKIYGGLETTKDCISKIGLSIRVITKFITNNNFRELFDFLIDDIVYYGTVKYDNYMSGEMIIYTNRFIYYLKEGVILNILNPDTSEIDECSLLFKPIRNNSSLKKSILDLDINDKIRSYITYEDIKALQPSQHVIDRFEERILKNRDFLTWGEDIKNDIYKFGTVMLGTYYTTTKLIRGKKYVYVISDRSIISIWKPNEFIDELNKKYFYTVNLN